MFRHKGTKTQRSTKYYYTEIQAFVKLGGFVSLWQNYIFILFIGDSKNNHKNNKKVLFYFNHETFLYFYRLLLSVVLCTLFLVLGKIHITNQLEEPKISKY